MKEIGVGCLGWQSITETGKHDKEIWKRKLEDDYKARDLKQLPYKIYFYSLR